MARMSCGDSTVTIATDELSRPPAAVYNTITWFLSCRAAGMISLNFVSPFLVLFIVKDLRMTCASYDPFESVFIRRELLFSSNFAIPQSCKLRSVARSSYRCSFTAPIVTTKSIVVHGLAPLATEGTASSGCRLAETLVGSLSKSEGWGLGFLIDNDWLAWISPWGAPCKIRGMAWDSPISTLY